MLMYDHAYPGQIKFHTPRLRRRIKLFLYYWRIGMAVA